MRNGTRKRSLADWQKPWYEILRKLIHAKGYPPTLKEWAGERGMGWSAAVKARNSLAKDGHITFEEGKSRSIQLVA